MKKIETTLPAYFITQITVASEECYLILSYKVNFD